MEGLLMKRIAALALMCTLLGCNPKSQGQSCPIPVPKIHAKHSVEVKKKINVDSRFTDEELKTISSAADEWSDATDHIVQYDVVPGLKVDYDAPLPSMIMLVKMKSTDPIASKIGIDEDFVSGTVLLPGTVIIAVVVDRIRTSDDLKAHIMRNLGTEMGLITYRGSYPGVMNGDMGDITCITKYDAILFCAKHICDWRELNYCTAEGGRGKVDKL